MVYAAGCATRTNAIVSNPETCSVHFTYVAPFVLNAALVLLLAVWVWPRRHRPIGRTFILFCLLLAYWSMTEGALYLGLDIETNLTITSFQYIGVVALTPLVLILSCITVGLEGVVSRARIPLLYIVPALTLLAVWTTRQHRLFYRDWYEITGGPFPMLGLDYGPLLWLWIAYAYAVLLATALILAYRLWKPAGSRRGQAAMLLASLLVTALANVIYLTGHSPVANMDISPMTFVFFAFALAWAILRHDFLDLVPIAKAEIFDHFRDAIVVLDDRDRLVAANPAAEALVGRSFQALYGAPIDSLFARWPDKPAVADEHWVDELTTSSPERHYELRFSPLLDSAKRTLGLLVIFQDVSERKRLERDLLRLATTDSLTGALNRRQVLAVAEEEAERHRRYGGGLSLLMLDLDNFKRINDSYGHGAGDEVIKAFAAACRASLRSSDCLGRFGGEEFVVLLPQTQLAAALQVAEKLRARVEAVKHCVGERQETVTASIGVAAMQAECDSVEELLLRADAALYRAKAVGRNRVVAEG